MFSGKMTTTSTADCSAEIIRLKNDVDHQFQEVK